MDQISDTIAQIRQALSDEVKARAAYPKKTILTNGVRAALPGGGAVYRFEIPENFLFEPSLKVQCTLGGKLHFTFPAVVADVHHQFAFFLFPFDMGDLISEVTCDWNPSEGVELLSARCEAVSPNEIVSALFGRDFSVNVRQTTKEPIFPSSFTPSQRDAVKKSAARRISIIIGERKRGKTGVAASLMFSAIREGKRVLYLTPSSGGLHDCMQEVVALNSVVAEESIAVVDLGMCLLPPLPIPAYSLRGKESASNAEGMKKLTKIIAAEYEYDRVSALVQRLSEKQHQVEEAAAEAEEIRIELSRLQSASMIERMKQRINKADIDNVQAQLQNKLALVERLKENAATLLKEQFKKESQLPIQLKEKKEIEKLASQQFELEPVFPQTLGAARCVAATVRQALSVDRQVLGEFDIVCIDDAHALNLAELFWCASNAKEQCLILADITEQPPQSVSQVESARLWLQKNYFNFFQQEKGDQVRFTISQLPENTASELVNPDLPVSLFESCLDAALEQTPLPQGAAGKVYFLNTEDQRAVSEQYLGKKKILPFNEANARRVVECVKHALLSGTTNQSDILIVTPPSGQTTYLRELLKAHQMDRVEIATLGSIRLCSKRSVIFDTTVAGIDFTLRLLDDKKLGLVRVADTFNTLLSTVREELYIVADLAYFSLRYKDRLITRLLGLLKGRSEAAGNILNAARRFDDFTPDLRKKVLFASPAEKKSAEYVAKIELAKATSSDPAKSPAQQSIAASERKLKSDVYSAVLRVLAKREVINLVAQYLEAFPLYKTTLETIKASVSLPDLECDNENEFKNVMNMWNILIYEASDAEKADHPLATKARVSSKIAMDMQQIHAYYHSDLEFVVEIGKHKLAQSVQQIFNDCIGKKPVTPTDWMKAYLVFLGRMEKYLDTVINQIRK